MAIRVNEDSFEEEVLNSQKPVLIDFYSDSCVPCKRLAPILAEIEEEFSDTLKVIKINVNFDNALAEKYEVMSVPTLILFNNGREQTRVIGAVKKAEILELIK